MLELMHQKQTNSSVAWKIEIERFYFANIHTKKVNMEKLGIGKSCRRAIWVCRRTSAFTRVHRKSVARIRPPVWILILSIGIRAPSCESTVALISCSHAQHVGVWRIGSRLVIRVNILLVLKHNLQQVATQTSRGAYCISSPLRFAPSARILVLGHGLICTGVEFRKQEYPMKSDSHRFCWCSVTWVQRYLWNCNN
jgi:hypothetical protein